MSAQKICPQCGTEYELDQRFCPKDGATLRLQDATQDLVGSIIADRYHVLRKLGEGGMGTVYLAEHVKMGRKSAVKVMNTDLVTNPDAISRFNREASNASKINHPNVCAVYDFGETSEGLTYLAMEFVEGPQLTKVIEDQGALPPRRAAEIARQVADALSIAHDMGIVHRDLKPDNIMLARNRDGSDLAKVVDFGIAKVATNEAQRVTKTGLVIGTPEYMSPEQLAGDKLDGRSDIYSLGLVTFNMLTGKLPFPAETLQESMIMRLTEKPKQLVEMKGDIAWPPQVQAVLDRALERAAEARYQTAGEFGRELYKAVTAMRDSTATSVIDRVSPPRSAPATRKSEGSLPPTRVGSATPHESSTAVVRKPKSRAPLFVGVAAVLLGLGTAGAYYATHSNAEGRVPSTTGQRDSTRVTPPRGDTSSSTGAIMPPVNLDREIEKIELLTNPGASTEQANQAILRLAQLDSVAALASDSTLLHFRFVRAKALLIANEREGCDSLMRIESKADSTRFERALRPLLDFCRKP